MKTTLTTMVLVSLLVGLGSIALMAEDGGAPNRELRIEWPDATVRNPDFFPEMTHVAEFHVINVNNRSCR